MARSVTIKARIETAAKAALEQAAKDDRRTLSQVVELAVLAYLRERGYLKE